VITGIGVVTPIGIGKERFWASLMDGQGGVRVIDAFDPAPFPTKIAAQVRDFDATSYMDRKEARRNDRFVHFAVAASRLALDDAAFAIGAHNANDVGVIIGSGIGGLATLEDQHKTMLDRGPDRVSPFFIPMMILNMASGIVSIQTGARGPNTAVVSACATGAHAIGDAYRVIQRGEAVAMLAGGTEATITPLAVAGFSAMKAMSTRNDDPARAVRPFDAQRDGFVMGEGAGVVLLEDLDHARKRNARVYGELAGYGASADAHHITMPDPAGDGASRSMARCLADAGAAPPDVDYINAHGTSTLYNDKFETLAIKRVFGDHARSLAVSSTKSMTGHLLGAAGGVELIVCALALQHQHVPPTINYEFPDADCDLDYVPNRARAAAVRVAISNAFGFGGHNCTLAVRQVDV
jgi:3-oxoacyl-[acyl-carrier-protein] synthase II